MLIDFDQAPARDKSSASSPPLFGSSPFTPSFSLCSIPIPRQQAPIALQERSVLFAAQPPKDPVRPDTIPGASARNLGRPNAEERVTFCRVRRRIRRYKVHHIHAADLANKPNSQPSEVARPPSCFNSEVLTTPLRRCNLSCSLP